MSDIQFVVIEVKLQGAFSQSPGLFPNWSL
jgi:hypothetical protein